MDGKMNRCRLGSLLMIVVLTASLTYGAETKQAKIKRALSAAPSQIAKSAKVVDMDAQGKMEVLRDGTNGFTCFPGHPGVVGDVAMCADAPSLQWASDCKSNKPKPTN